MANRPSENNFSILTAAASGDLEYLQQLKSKYGCDDFRIKCNLVEDCGGNKVLHYAASNGMIQICRFLIEEVGVDVNTMNARGDSPLLDAASEGHIHTAKYLIIRGAHVKKSGYEGITCLLHAAENGSKELMQMLLLKGADIEAHSVHGTPLQCAALCGNVESVRFLLRRRADPNSVSPFSFSPLMGAILCQSSECMELLLKFGADPNASSRGLSPLAVAARGGDAEFLRSLLAAGANPNLVTTERLKPIEHAAENRNLEGVGILLPVTQSIQKYPDWSIHGITNYFHSEKAKRKREQRKNANLQLFGQKGKNAINRGDYEDAVKWLSEAIYLDSPNSKAELRANRSKCWKILHKGAFSLCDAEACIKLRPDWPEAFFLAGHAWMLLGIYHMACGAFLKAYELDPGKEAFKKSYGEAYKFVVLDLAKMHLPETLILLHTILRSHGLETFPTSLFLLAEKNPWMTWLALKHFLCRSDLSPLC